MKSRLSIPTLPSERLRTTHGPARRVRGQGRKALPRESGGRPERPSSDEWQGSRGEHRARAPKVAAGPRGSAIAMPEARIRPVDPARRALARRGLSVLAFAALVYLL